MYAVAEQNCLFKYASERKKRKRKGKQEETEKMNINSYGIHIKKPKTLKIKKNATIPLQLKCLFISSM